ncbi:MAG: glycosyltransferase family 2 protein [Elainellaceae cyanobacterium]
MVVQTVRNGSLRPQFTTLILLGITAIASLIAIAWFAGNGAVTQLFERIDALQSQPPMWLMAPRMVGEYFLFWTVALMVVVFLIMRVSPRPTAWSRAVVVAILGALAIRYLFWRSLSTLNLSTPLNGVFSLGLFFLELLILSNGIIQLVLLLRARDRRSQADQLAPDVLEGRYRPSVDILIPTYNEPEFILRRTVIGCQALNYDQKTIYLLDDTRRPWVQTLAAELGCEYRTRPNNQHAKAGNLNYTIPKTSGELIVVFDADFIPTQDFLTRTVGFFQDPNVALVQTPQTFYNPDPIARNLGMEDVLTPEEEVFYRQIQRVRDGAGGVVCAGTSFVVRRTALASVGGFVTEAVSEDFFTGIRLAAKGYRLIYLNEKLSAGLAAENIASHAVQRVRWAQGTLQSFFISDNPLTIPGLNFMQRLAYFEGLLHWFSSVARVGFLLMPLAYSFLGVVPLEIEDNGLLYFFLPYYLVQLTTFSWLNYRARSALLSEVYSLVLAFPLALTVLRVMVRPFGKGFQVTPKGTASDRYQFNWQLAWPLLIAFVLTAVSLWINLGNCLLMDNWRDAVTHIQGTGIGWIWSAYNLLMIGIALLILLDAPRPDVHEWFDVSRIARITLNGKTHWGFSTMLSERGGEFALTSPPQASLSDAPAQIELVDERIQLSGQVTRTGSQEFPTVRVAFNELPLPAERQLVRLLFCRPGQWRSRCAPGELRSLWLIFKILLRPRVLFDRNVDVRPVSVAKV